MAMSKTNTNDAVFQALGHPIRRKILRVMDESGTVSPSQLTKELGLTPKKDLGRVAYHMRVLAEAGVVKLRKTKPRRGAVEHFYANSGNKRAETVGQFLELIGKD